MQDGRTFCVEFDKAEPLLKGFLVWLKKIACLAASDNMSQLIFLSVLPKPRVGSLLIAKACSHFSYKG